jgi:tRNA G37 N-methylase TrmD
MSIAIAEPKAGRRLPPGVEGLSDREIEERAERISIRNREWAERKVHRVDREDDIGGHGFNMPAEGWT